MDKTAILQKLKDITGIRGLLLPAHFHIEENKGMASMRLPAVEGKQPLGVTANMQQDSSAFEGWATCMKAAVPGWDFCLDWTVPQNKDDGHYQRFLYRVNKFKKYYGDWFSTADDRAEDLASAQINEDEKYLLNAPTNTDDRVNDAEHLKENLIENAIIKTQPHVLNELFNIQRLERQLPVGAFKEKVSKATAIFPRGKSAVDIWGISSNNELVFFELKAPGNMKVGVISELFFYAMILQDEQEDKCTRDHQWGKNIRATTSLKAMVLAEDVHPLITRPVFDCLNKPFTDGRIQFGYVRTTVNMGFGKIY